MGGIIRLNSLRFNGCTLLEALNQLATDSDNDFYKDQPMVVQKNGNMVMTTDYDWVLVSAEDEIIIIPLIAGG